MELDFLLGIAAVIATVIASVASLAYWLGRKFAPIDARLARLESEMESRFARMESYIEGRFARVEERIDALARFTRSVFTLLVDCEGPLYA